MRTRHAFAATLLATLLIAACGSDDTTEVATEPDETTTTESDMSDDPADDTTTTSASGTPDMSRADVAIDDLAAQLGVDADDIEVVSDEAVTWSDSSLGCPREGFMYQQVITDGFRIVLEADGSRYQYHSGDTGDPFLCANPQEPASVG